MDKFLLDILSRNFSTCDMLEVLELAWEGCDRFFDSSKDDNSEEAIELKKDYNRIVHCIFSSLKEYYRD